LHELCFLAFIRVCHDSRGLMEGQCSPLQIIVRAASSMSAGEPPVTEQPEFGTKSAGGC
jgi:hypothetical protein